MRLLVAVALLLSCSPALAQTAAPATSVDAVPKLACDQPKIPERFSVAREDIAYLEKQVNAYGTCVKSYVDERQAKAQHYSDLAKTEADAANIAVQTVNDYYAKVKAFEAAHKEKGTQSSVGN